LLQKIYKAMFVPPDDIRVTFVRNAYQDEDVKVTGMCIRVRYGNKYVYRICDDPERDAILLDATDDQLKDLKLACIHRGKVFYAPAKFEGLRASIFKLKENIIV
ncbi:hypothetical protein PMAYCL1PPCAC_08688, partial [Pristionchus mayeri]